MGEDKRSSIDADILNKMAITVLVHTAKEADVTHGSLQREAVIKRLVSLASEYKHLEARMWETMLDAMKLLNPEGFPQDEAFIGIEAKIPDLQVAAQRYDKEWDKRLKNLPEVRHLLQEAKARALIRISSCHDVIRNPVHPSWVLTYTVPNSWHQLHYHSSRRPLCPGSLYEQVRYRFVQTSLATCFRCHCVFRRSRPPVPTSRPVIPIHADHSGGAGVHSGAGVWG